MEYIINEYIINQEVLNLKSLLDESGLATRGETFRHLSDALIEYMEKNNLNNE